MARSARPVRRVNNKNDRVNYLKSNSYGNTARKLNATSGVQGRERTQNRRNNPKQQNDRQMKEKRIRARQIGPGYVLFLTFICCVTIILCVQYLRLRSTVTTQIETIAAKESELSTLKAENDAYYNQAMASVTLDDVRDAALNRLGLHNAVESQIEYYSTDDSGYVRQYQDVPK